MKFKLLLWFMAQRMRRLAKTNPEFAAKLKAQDFLILIQTASGRSARYFQAKDGVFSSRAQKHKDPKVTVIFESSKYGFETLTAKSKSAFMDGIQSQKIKVEGDFMGLMGFMGLMSYLRPKKAKKPVADPAQ